MNSILALILSVTLLTGSPVTRQANVSVQVRDLETGAVISEHRADHVVPPASVMKLLTTGAALELLGSDFRFTTTLEYDGVLQGGVLHGDLYIRGGCDPTLGTRLDARGRNVQHTAFLRRWVQAVREAGIRRIEGSIVADMCLLDGEAQNPAWLAEDVGNYYAPGIFSLNYLANTMNILLQTGPVGSIAAVTGTEPTVPDLVFHNHIRCTTTTEDGAFVHGLPYSNERYLTGSVPSNRGMFGVRGDLPNPGLLLAQHLQRALGEAGITVTSAAHYITQTPVLTPPRTMVYEHRSDTLGAIVAATNLYSNNLYAESIFRYLGLQYGQPGTIHNASEVVRAFWRSRGVSITGTLIKDGCGLAPQNAVSAATLVQLLTYMNGSRCRKEWYASLPVSGRSGTLKSLLSGTELEGRVHAKSGTIGGTKNFAGYIDLPDGRRWAFAVLINSAPGKAKNIQPVIEKYLLDVYRSNR